MVKINETFRSLIPPLSDSEYAELEQSIIAEGCRDPLYVWKDTIVDGHNRYEICVKHNIPFCTKEINFDSEDDAQIWIINNQLGRRNITEFSRIELALKRKDILLTLGREKKQIAGKEARDKQLGVLSIIDKTPEEPQTDILSNVDKKLEPQTDILTNWSKGSVEPHNTQKIIADELGWSTGKVAMAERVVNDASEELKDQLRRGEMSINRAYRDIKRTSAMDKSKASLLPTDKYRVIYADPPWKYNDKLTGGYGIAEFHYPTMTIDELCTMPIKEIVEDDAVLFLWVTSPLLEDSFRVINSWGFKYKSSFIWDKVGHNYGHYNSVRHEFLLICTRGSCTPDNNILIDSVQSIPKSDKHSEKPEEFRKIIDTLYTEGKRLELFARCKPNDRWEYWGNETNR